MLVKILVSGYTTDCFALFFFVAFFNCLDTKQHIRKGKNLKMFT